MPLGKNKSAFHCHGESGSTICAFVLILGAARWRSIKLRRLWCIPLEMHLENNTIVIFPPADLCFWLLQRAGGEIIADYLEIMCQLWLMLPFKMSRQKGLYPMLDFFLFSSEGGFIRGIVFCLVCTCFCAHRLIQVWFWIADEMGCIFLLLWQHWLVWLIAWFRTETAHSLLLPIQQSRSTESSGDTDEMMRWSRILMMLY